MAAMDHDLYCCRFSVFRRSEFSGSQPDEWSVSFENGGYYDGGICFVSQHGTLVCYNVPFEISFYFPGGVVNLRLTICVGCSLICVSTGNVVVLVLASFVAGFFRMWGTFECNSSIQLWLTPKRDMAVFFCYIFLMVNACIQFSGLTTVHVATWINWEYVYWFVIGLLLAVILFVLVAFQDKRFMPYLPLYGIDWLGAVLWAISVLAMTFVRCLRGAL